MPWLLHLIAPAAVMVAAAVTMPMILVSADAGKPMPANEAPTVSATELKAFAAASLRVEAIGDRWQSRIDAAEDSEQETLRRRAAGEMADAVLGEGLTVDRYNRLALALRSDPDLARAVQSYRVALP